MGRRTLLDGPLFAALLLLCGMSLVILYSAGGGNMDLIWRQFVRLSIALFAMVMVSFVSIDTLKRWSPHVYLAGLVLLGMVLAVGIIGKGAQRWLDLGVTRFQPSELMKIAVPMMVAWYIGRNHLPPRPLHLIIGFVIVMDKYGMD